MLIKRRRQAFYKHADIPYVTDVVTFREILQQEYEIL